MCAMRAQYFVMIGASVLGAALTTFACSSDDGGGGGPSEQDSGADAVIDRVRVDREDPPEEDAGDPTWCTEQPDNIAVFCDDFDKVGYDLKSTWTTVTETPGASANTGNGEKTSGGYGLRMYISASATDAASKLVEAEKAVPDLNTTKVFLWELDLKAASCAGWNIQPSDAGTDDAGDDDAEADAGDDDAGGGGDPQPVVTFASLNLGDNIVYLGATADRQFVIRETQVGNEAVHTTPFYVDGSFQRISIQVTPGASKKATVLTVKIASPIDIDGGAVTGVDIPIGTEEIKASVVKASIRASVAADQTCTAYFDNVLLGQSHGPS
jgi:hypothetical protein